MFARREITFAPGIVDPVTAARILWGKLLAFKFDDIDAERPFSQRLAEEQGWEPDFTVRVIEEYRKFVFLMMAADHMCVPSKIVDEAWHLHLLYTRSYWEELCTKTLGRIIHHGPGKGGKKEDAKYADFYSQTLNTYAEFFGEPPQDIWGVRKRNDGEECHCEPLFGNAVAVTLVDHGEQRLLTAFT
jgi:hypothetical protein